MTSKKVSLLIICLALSSVTVQGCGQVPIPTSTATVGATSGFDTPPSPTPRPTSTPTPTSSPSATIARPAAPSLTSTDEPELDESHKSGIQGQVLRGPMCAGPISVDDPCPDQPFSATFYVLDSQGSRVTSFRTGEDGYFQVLLAPGEYTIVPDRSAPLMPRSNQRKDVTVRDQELVLVTLVFDTGIR